MKHIFSILILFFSCGKKEENEPIKDISLEAKSKLYCELSKGIYEKQKYVVDECDGAGFTALYAVACPQNKVDISVFQNKEGKMFRNPKHDCFPKNSASEFSKDHVLMSMVAWHELHRNDLANKFKKFVDKNKLKFCEGKDVVTTTSRCILSTTLYFLLSKISHSSSNLRQENANLIKDGFEGHLDVIGIWLDGKVNGGISEVQKQKIKKYAEKEQLNALYQSVAYRYGLRSIEDVNKSFYSKRFPDDRLPTNTEYCTEYLFQRDSNSKDWQPCADKKVHTGTDFVFAYYVLSN